MKLFEIDLTVSEIGELQQACDILRTCPNFGDKAIGFHRSHKSLTSTLKDLQEEAELLKSNYQTEVDKIKEDNKDEKSTSYKDAMKKANKDLETLVTKFNKTKHSVGVYIFNKEDFPTEPSEFGEKEIIVETKEDALKHKVSFWDSFVKTIDIIVLEKEEYEKKRLELKSKPKDK